MAIYNMHIHTFKHSDVNKGFLPFNLVDKLENKKFSKCFINILKRALPGERDILERVAQFAETGLLPTQEDIFLQTAQNFPKDTKFIILAIDMRGMSEKGVSRKYIDQLIELAELRDKYPDNIIPFVHVDPLQPDYLHNFRYAIDVLKFKGVKLYPPMSLHHPQDKKLILVYKYCDEKGLTIITHCGFQSPTYLRASVKEIRQKLDELGIVWTKDMNKAKLCGQTTHPLLFEPLYDKYKNVTWILAHHGGSKALDEYLRNPSNLNNIYHIINRQCKEYDNVYTDISYTYFNEKYWDILINNLRDVKLSKKFLFGDDYYMLCPKKITAKEFYLKLRNKIGEDNWKLISETNSKNSLKIS